MASLQKAIGMEPGRSSPLSRSRTSSINSDSGSSSSTSDTRSLPRSLRSPYSQLAAKTSISQANRNSSNSIDVNQNESKSHTGAEDREPQEPKFVREMKDLEVVVGDPATFEVQVTGFPEPTVAWFKENEEVKRSRRHLLERRENGVHSLTISRCQMNDDAEYECRATNCEGVTSCHGDLFVDPDKKP